VHLVGFIIRIFHDARSPECNIRCSNLVGFMDDEALFNNSVRVTGPYKEVHCTWYRIWNGFVSGSSSS